MKESSTSTDLAPAQDKLAALEGPGREAPATQFRQIPISDIAEIETIRKFQEDAEFEKLMRSLHEQHQLSPVLVRPALPGATHGKSYELVSGYRRKKAAEKFAWTTLQAQVREIPNREVLEIMLAENMQRAPLSPMEEARAIKAMVEFGGMRQADVARRLGITPAQVSKRLSLLELAPAVQKSIESGELSASHGVALTALPPARQEKMAKWAGSSGVSVTKLADKVREAVVTAEDIKGELEAGPTGVMDPVLPSDVVPLEHAVIRPDLSQGDRDRLQCWINLRSGNDQEMLDWLRENEGVEWDTLWTWVGDLTDEQAHEMLHRLQNRYFEAAHRFPLLEQQMLDELAAGTEMVGPPEDDDFDDAPDWED